MRTDLLGRNVADGALTTYRDMVRMFWTAVEASTIGPESFAGKLLGHSSQWVTWKRAWDEATAAAIGAAAWANTSLAQAVSSDAMTAREFQPPSGDALGWCYRARACPLHVVTHVPAGVLGGLPLGCALPDGPRPAFLSMPGFQGAFAVSSLRPARFALVSERLAADDATSGVCAFAAQWVRQNLAHVSCLAEQCPLHLAVTQLNQNGKGGAASRVSVTCRL